MINCGLGKITFKSDENSEVQQVSGAWFDFARPPSICSTVVEELVPG